VRAQHGLVHAQGDARAVAVQAVIDLEERGRRNAASERKPCIHVALMRCGVSERLSGTSGAAGEDAEKGRPKQITWVSPTERVLSSTRRPTRPESAPARRADIVPSVCVVSDALRRLRGGEPGDIANHHPGVPQNSCPAHPGG
jgi:hypothetical protein